MGSDRIDFADRESYADSPSSDGSVSLSWEKDESLSIVVEQAADAAFTDPKVRYEGTDTGTVLTGLPEGMHYFRIRSSGESEWSEPLEMKVEFFERRKLALLLGIGGVVVIATIGSVIVGFLRTKGEGADA